MPPDPKQGHAYMLAVYINNYMYMYIQIPQPNLKSSMKTSTAQELLELYAYKNLFFGLNILRLAGFLLEFAF